jgi:hypothetical protein
VDAEGTSVAVGNSEGGGDSRGEGEGGVDGAGEDGEGLVVGKSVGLAVEVEGPIVVTVGMKDLTDGAALITGDGRARLGFVVGVFDGFWVLSTAKMENK